MCILFISCFFSLPIIFFSVSDAKLKWKNLKDQFRKEVKKIPVPKSGDPSLPVKPKWQYFDQIYFLKDFVVPLQTQGNLQMETNSQTQGTSLMETQDSSESENGQGDDDNNIMSPQNPYSPGPSRRPSESSSNSYRQKKKKTDVQDKFLELENRKVQLLEQDCKEENPDLMFFKSLLPHMTDFTDLEKLEIKSEILSLILKRKKKKQPVDQNIDGVLQQGEQNDIDGELQQIDYRVVDGVHTTYWKM